MYGVESERVSRVGSAKSREQKGLPYMASRLTCAAADAPFRGRRLSDYDSFARR